jgi:hypothetical protein
MPPPLVFLNKIIVIGILVNVHYALAIVDTVLTERFRAYLIVCLAVVELIAAACAYKERFILWSFRAAVSVSVDVSAYITVHDNTTCNRSQAPQMLPC